MRSARSFTGAWASENPDLPRRIGSAIAAAAEASALFEWKEAAAVKSMSFRTCASPSCKGWGLCVALVALVLTGCADTSRDEGLPVPLDAERVEPADVDVKPEIRTMDPPDYPERAREMGIEGTVLFDVFVDETGRIKELRMTKGVDPLIDEAATRALRSAVFTPARKNGVPVAVWVRALALTFSLHD